MKKCLFCGKGFEPKNPKGKFCSSKCRVYSGRGKNKTILDATKPSHEVKAHEQPQTNYVINTERIAELEKELAAIPDKTRGYGRQLADSIKKKILNLKYPKQ